MPQCKLQEVDSIPSPVVTEEQGEEARPPFSLSLLFV